MESDDDWAGSRGEEQPCITSGDKKTHLAWNRNPWLKYQMATFIKFMGRELVKWKKMQKAKMAAIKCCPFRF